MIIIDSNYVSHVAKHAMKGFSYEDMKTGVIFGFLRQLLSLATKFDSNEMIFVWDSKNNLREKIYPEYKIKRKDKRTVDDKEMDTMSYPQFNILKNEILPSIFKCNIFSCDGYEGDDIIARIIQDYHKSTFMIVSSDEDLYQLLDKDRVQMYKIRPKLVYTEEMLMTEYNCRPSDWASVKAIAGCVTDEVPGVPNVGAKTAVKHLHNELKTSSKAFADIMTSKALIARNRRLVTLPLVGCPPFVIEPSVSPSLDAFIDVCNKYGLMSFLYTDNLKKWIKTFNME